MKKEVWIDEEDSVVINKSFVNYWVLFREMIKESYPTIYEQIDKRVKERL